MGVGNGTTAAESKFWPEKSTDDRNTNVSLCRTIADFENFMNTSRLRPFLVVLILFSGLSEHGFSQQADELFDEEIAIGMSVRGFDLSADGKYAVVWGKAKRNSKTITLSVIDVATREVQCSREIARKSLDASIGSSASDYTIVVKPRASESWPKKEIYLLSLKDLSELNSGIAPYDYDYCHADLLGKELVASEHGILKLPGFQLNNQEEIRFAPKKEHVLARAKMYGQMENKLPVHGGAIWDNDFQKGQLIFDTGFFRNCQVTGSSSDRLRATAFPGRWGISLDRNQLFQPRFHGEGFARWLEIRHPDYKDVVLLEDKPAACKVAPHTGTESAVCVEVRSVATGKKTQTVPVGAYEKFDKYSKIKSGGQCIAVLNASRLCFIDTDKIDATKLPTPMRIERTQEILSFAPPKRASNDKVKIEYQILDGKPPFKATFELAKLPEKQKMEGNKVSFDVDLGEIRRQLTDGLKSMAKVQDYGIPQYLDNCKPIFKKLTGRDPKGLPMFVAANVRVMDADNNEAHMAHGFLIEIPFKSFMPQGRDVAVLKKSSDGVVRKVDRRKVATGKVKRESKLAVLPRTSWAKTEPEPLELDDQPWKGGDLLSNSLKAPTSDKSKFAFSDNKSMGFVLNGDVVTAFSTKTWKPYAAVKLDFPATMLGWMKGKLVVYGGNQNLYEFTDSKGITYQNLEPPREARSRQIQAFDCWIVDPKRLKPLKGYRLPGYRALIDPRSTRALAFEGWANDKFDVLDLGKGKRVASFDQESIKDAFKEERKRIEKFEIAFAEKGKSLLFWMRNSESESQLCLCSIVGDDKLKLKRQSGPVLAARTDNDGFQLNPMIEPSPDGSMVGIKVNRGFNFRPQEFGYYIFNLQEIEKPIGSIFVPSGKSNRVRFENLFLIWNEAQKLITVSYGNQITIAGDGNENIAAVPTIATWTQVYNVPGQGTLFHGKVKSVLLKSLTKYKTWSFGVSAASSAKAEAKVAVQRKVGGTFPEVDSSASIFQAKSSVPKSPLKFEGKKGRTPSLEFSPNSATFAADGKSFYLAKLDHNSKTFFISKFDTESKQEVRRLVLAGEDANFRSGWNIEPCRSGLLLRQPENNGSSGRDLIFIDGDSMNPTRGWVLPEKARLCSSPATDLIPVSLKGGDLSIFDVSQGEIVSHFSIKENRDGLTDKTLRQLESEHARAPDTLISLDGKTVFQSFAVVRRFALDDSKLTLLETSPPATRNKGAYRKSAQPELKEYLIRSLFPRRTFGLFADTNVGKVTAIQFTQGGRGKTCVDVNGNITGHLAIHPTDPAISIRRSKKMIYFWDEPEK